MINKPSIQTEKVSEAFNKLLENLAKTPKAHSPYSVGYRRMENEARQEIEALFSGEGAVNVEPFGVIRLPYDKMTTLHSSIDLWGLDELILFSFYYQNRNRYKKTFDIGANIGLHSIIMSRCGFSVTAYEPDPIHYNIMMHNLKLNGCQENVKVEQAAVSYEEGTEELIRITNNHLLDPNDDVVLRPIERFSVKTVNISNDIKNADLIKINTQGHEAVIIESFPNETFQSVDIFIEIGNQRNAESIFNRFTKLNVNMFAQRQSWKKVADLSEMPTSYRDGSLFISSKDDMPW